MKARWQKFRQRLPSPNSMRRAAAVLTIICFGVLVVNTELRAQKAPVEMSKLPTGRFTPQYKIEGQPPQLEVESFLLDRYPVTNADFLAFVTSRPEWRRDRVPAVFAEQGFLRHWAGVLTLGPLAPPRAPVVNVSWFAARAYCALQEKTLPTVMQWEYAAAADEHAPDAATAPAFYSRILRWYGKPTSVPLPEVGKTYQNLWGVWDLHGLTWEWVDDFSSAMVSGESRTEGAVDKQLFCATGNIGAADFNNYASFMRYAFRSSLEARYTVGNLGFRCAKALAE